uniref:Glutamate carboxypeptidase 2 n=1 Tax=Parascaris univalens TaxID=6257 RepID=A0A915AJ70_PARUN
MPYAKDPNANALCSKAMMRATSVLGAGFVAIVLVGLLGVYHTAHPARQPRPETIEDYHQSISEKLIANVEGENIKENLRLLTILPHPAGTRANTRVAEKIADLWRKNGLADVHYLKYEVLLSYPDYDRPNHVYIIDEDGRIEFASKGVSPVIIPEEQGAEGAGVQWIAYSGNGTAQGEVVYCHYGRVEDFERLDRLGVTVKGKIALLRYGNGFRGDKVRNAQMNGATGAILYSDPAEVARMGPYPEKVYPNTEWMPLEGAQRGTIMMGNGDPLSPLYPSKKDLYRPKTVQEAKNDGTLPTIPVLPIGYSDAFQILSRMQGRMVPLDWQGGLNISYRLGPRLGDGATVRIDVRSSLQTRTIRNVIGYIHGADDPDRYVILGNHFDAWVYGSIDPNSGTAVLAEVARAITQTINETNWRPARTIMFCSWDGEEHGIIGSTEFVEEFANILTQRAVVYLNVDNIHSNASLFASTVPTLYQKVTEVAKRIPNPVVAEVKRGRKTVYDTWVKTFPNEIEFRPDAPKLPIPGAGSDHTAFLNFLGIPVVDFTYKNATTYDTYPLYHSLYETPFVNEHIFDTNNFAVHVAVGQYWAELAREFTDSAVLPFNISDLANSLLRIYLPNLKRAMEPLKYRADEIKDAREQLSRLIKNCQEFLRRAEAFSLVIKQALRNFAINPFDSRRISLINDRIMGVDRCFINPRGLPRQPSQRHVLFSTSDRDSYTGRVMAAVYDQVDAFVESKTHRERQLAARNIATEISLIQYAVQCASNTIADRI